MTAPTLGQAYVAGNGRVTPRAKGYTFASEVRALPAFCVGYSRID
jgi:hypothetical protein